jgi:hypothetical protein
LLTPDKLPNTQDGQYVTNIIRLIKAARNSIYLQLQYIEASEGNRSLYDHLLQAIAGQIAANTDVKLIVSANYAEKWGEKMKDEGVDLTANIRTLPNVHNKGFIIDGETVVVSSQNFSPSRHLRESRCGPNPRERANRSIFWAYLRRGLARFTSARGSRSAPSGRGEEEKKASLKKDEKGKRGTPKIAIETKCITHGNGIGSRRRDNHSHRRIALFGEMIADRARSLNVVGRILRLRRRKGAHRLCRTVPCLLLDLQLPLA